VGDPTFESAAKAGSSVPATPKTNAARLMKALNSESIVFTSYFFLGHTTP